jgi:hypothetical protein
MGLLDDAIREHLDLKRRRGADPAEVERAEREALGPVRRNRDPGDADEPQDQVPANGGSAYDQDEIPAAYELDETYAGGDLGYEEDGDQEWGAGAPAGTDATDPRSDLLDDLEEDEPWMAPEPSPGRESGSIRPRSLGAPSEEAAPLEDWTAAGDDELAAEPFPSMPDSPGRSADSGSPHRPADPGPPHPPADPGGGETTEFNVEEAMRSTDGQRDDDMLEETPEFLQDTPDHDRLWFEQRPPRDFDFED